MDPGSKGVRRREIDLTFFGVDGWVILVGLGDSNKQQDGLECFTVVLGQTQHVDSNAATVVVSSLLCPLSSSCLLLGQQGAPPARRTVVNMVQLDAIVLAPSLNKLSRQIWKTETQNDLLLNTYVHLNTSCPPHQSCACCNVTA